MALTYLVVLEISALCCIVSSVRSLTWRVKLKGLCTDLDKQIKKGQQYMPCTMTNDNTQQTNTSCYDGNNHSAL